LKGHGFNRAAQWQIEFWALQAAEKPSIPAWFFSWSGFLGLFGLFLPRFPLFVLCLEAVLPASRHTSALLGERFNRSQSPHAHRVLRRDARLPEPVRSIQSAQLHLARLAI